jgi:hypothetical protein
MRTPKSSEAVVRLIPKRLTLRLLHKNPDLDSLKILFLAFNAPADSPDGREFVPSTPKGPLAGDRHLYALVTVEQFGRGSRGSVFVTLDGRVFDYSVVQTDPDREMFDTGYTIHHLKRTGRYASSVPIKKTDRQKTLKKKAGV